MNITPERALELAEWAKDTASYFDTTDEHGYIVTEAEEEKQIYLQVSACLKSYAEILPKWQAVLDAKVIGVASSMPSAKGGFTMACFNGNDVPEGTQLIIKPAP